MIKVTNPKRGADVTDYNVDGEFYSIAVGETVSLPDHVAEYLCKVYGFLEMEQEMRTAEDVEAELEEEVIAVVKEKPTVIEELKTKQACPECGKEYKNLAPHMRVHN